MCLLSCDLYKNLCVHLVHTCFFLSSSCKSMWFLYPDMDSSFLSHWLHCHSSSPLFPQHVSIIRIPVNKPPLARSAYRFTPLGPTWQLVVGYLKHWHCKENWKYYRSYCLLYWHLLQFPVYSFFLWNTQVLHQVLHWLWTWQVHWMLVRILVHM